jgi:hypothetical protein
MHKAESMAWGKAKAMIFPKKIPTCLRNVQNIMHDKCNCETKDGEVRGECSLGQKCMPDAKGEEICKTLCV